MDMPAIAVTGASGLIGRRLLAKLAADPAVTRVVGLDVREPEGRPQTVEFHHVDIAGSKLVPLLAGVDVIVHLAGVVDPIVDEKLMARVNVGGTRQVLDAAVTVAARRVVRISSATVYGAWKNNPLPLTEDAPLRPNPKFSPAVQGAEVERLLAEWRDEHPHVITTTLRAAAIVGPGAERLPGRVFLGRPRLRVRGAEAPVQVVHVDDVVSALSLVASTDVPGVFNVAADGWLAREEAEALLPSTNVPALPEEALERLLRRAWVTGVGDIPSGIVPYLVHPWVIANDRLRELGWKPQYSNEDAIREGVAALPPRRRVASRAAVGAAAGTAVAGAALVVRRRRKRSGGE